MNIVSEWINWKLFRPKGAFRGYWNMTEQELRDKETEKIYSAFDELVKMFVVRRWFVNQDFITKVLKEFKKQGEEHLKMQLELKEEEKC
jgi:hypothetical protein